MSCRYLPILMMCIVLASSARADSTSAWRIGGMIDTYARHIVESSPISLFGIELAMVDLRFKTDDVRARVALHAGNYVDRNYSGSTPYATTLLHALHAAFAGVRLGDELWVDVGIMPSHIGNEIAISSENITYTRSLIAEASPYFETGAKVSWSATKELHVAVLALNGWQNIYALKAETAFGSLVVFEPSTAWKFGWSTFIGEVPVGTSYVASTRYFNDVYASYTTADLTVAAAFDIGMQQLPPNFRNFPTDTLDATWWGATLQMRYRFDSVLTFSARAETFSDPNNAVLTGGRPSTEEPIIPYEVVGGSIGLDVTPRQYTQLRFETKMLQATRDVYSRTGEGGPRVYCSNQLWFTAALVVTIP